MPVDRYRNSISDVDSPAEFAYEIPDMHVPDGDSTIEVGVLNPTTRAIYIGISGNVYCRLANSYNPNADLNDGQQANVFFQGVVAGTILPLRVQAIWANNYDDDTSNTTARGIIGLY